MDVADVDGYDWNWSAKYEEEMVKELTDAYRIAFVAVLPALPVPLVQQIAAEWARVEAAEMIVNISSTTKQRVRDIIGGGLETGQSIGQMQKAIREDYVFSRDRARTVARTESARALGQGQKGAAISDGRDEKHWVTSEDAFVTADCRGNSNAGWIAMADPFPSGVDTIPQHPNCRCVVRYRAKEFQGVTASFRCEGCNKLLGKDVHEGTRIVCRSCKVERILDKSKNAMQYSSKLNSPEVLETLHEQHGLPV